MKAIKALVIGMTALIVLGLGLLVYGLTHKDGHPAARDAGTAAAPDLPGTPVPFFTAELNLPAGARIEQMTVASGMVVLHVTGAPTGERILMVDPRTGRVAGTILVTPEGR